MCIAVQTMMIQERRRIRCQESVHSVETTEHNKSIGLSDGNMLEICQI